MRHCVAFAAALALAPPAFADVARNAVDGSVGAAMDRIEAAATEAGATVFARIDHAAGAREAGMELPDEQLLIFGNPKLGTPVMQADPLAGLYLPLRILVYADGDGQTWVAYEPATDTFKDVGGAADALKTMDGALQKFAAAAGD